MSRAHPQTRKGYLLVAHLAFTKGTQERGFSESFDLSFIRHSYLDMIVQPIKLRKTKVKYILGVSISVKSYDDHADSELLRGLPSSLIDIPPVHAHEGSDHEGEFSEIVVPDIFPPGSILLFETQMEGIDAHLDTFLRQGADEAFADLNLVELNVVLHRSEGEELDATDGAIGAYDVPGMGKLVYCGLEGWMHSLRHIMKYNDLGHPVCENLRAGTWAFDYVHSRLLKYVDVRSILCSQR